MFIRKANKNKIRDKLPDESKEPSVTGDVYNTACSSDLLINLVLIIHDF